ncbi:MAG: hypothetical protein KDI68_12840 [Gammaproteobacteria bacterium]|nr:hypothetical protein [Gammaproteobacteria bacterium]
MITLLRLAGILLLILVGYHYINQPIGFSVAGSVATVIFGICLMELYPGYRPDPSMLGGWLLIGLGCTMIAMLSGFGWSLAVAIIVLLIGYRLACLPIDFGSSAGHGADTSGFGGSCDGGGDGGGCGD